MIPGLRLRQTRERLGLTYRDVEKASYQVAGNRGRSDFIVHISRLSEIENHGAIPGAHKIYSLAAIYHLDPINVFEWYDIPVANHFHEGAELPGRNTHMAAPPRTLRLPLRFDPAFDPRRCELLSRMVESWSELEGAFLRPEPHCQYGYIGLDDHMMEPLLRPGSLVLVDCSRREVSNGGWANEYERPIYFVDLRDSYVCAWCVEDSKQLILQPHSLSPCRPRIMRCPDEAEIVGRVTGVVTRLATR
ncbi:MAG TPA: XRE family transcriptional regulator [Candidatus Acidoferrales bacterium]|nr:XRE family transcriptional regulator [Candidatus Acidoferrales bacterium]